MKPEIVRDKPSRFRAFAGPLALLPVFLVAYGLNWRTTLIGDSMAHLFQAASLAWSGDYCLDEYRALLLKTNGGQLPYFVMASGGHLRSIFNFFPALLLAPVFKLAGLVCGESFRNSVAMWGLAGKLVASLLGAGSGFFLWGVLARRVARPVAWLALIAFWFGSPLWPMSIDYLQHQPEIFFRLAGLYVIFGSCGRRSGGHFFAGGVLLASSVLCRYQSMMTSAVIAGFVLWQQRQDRRAIAGLIAGGLLLVPPTLWYHHIAFGSCLAKGPMLFLAFNFPLAEGVAALLFNPSKGLFIHSPWALACCAMPLWLCRRVRDEDTEKRDLGMMLLAATVPTLMLYGKLNGWFGGWSWGYRYLMDILPELAILFAFAADQLWKNRACRGVAILGVALSVVIQGIGAMGYDHDWHRIHDLGIGPSQRWLWQIRNNQIVFTARRGLVHWGERSEALWPDPYREAGLYDVEQWDGKPFAWTAREARFLYLARSRTPMLKIYAPPAKNENGQENDTADIADTTDIHVKVTINGKQVGAIKLARGTWRDVPLAVPFQHSAMIQIGVDRTVKERKGGRELGVAVGAEDIVGV